MQTSTYTRISVEGKNKSTASGGKGSGLHKAKKAYYALHVGNKTTRTGTRRTNTSHPQNNDFLQPLVRPVVVAKAT